MTNKDSSKKPSRDADRAASRRTIILAVFVAAPLLTGALIMLHFVVNHGYVPKVETYGTIFGILVGWALIGTGLYQGASRREPLVAAVAMAGLGAAIALRSLLRVAPLEPPTMQAALSATADIGLFTALGVLIWFEIRKSRVTRDTIPEGR